MCEIEDNVCVRDSNNSGHNDDLDSTLEQSDGDNDADATQGSSDSATDNNTDGSDTSVSDNDTDMDTDSGDSTPDSDTDTDTTPADPCDPNPCLNVANSTKECIETGNTTYSCKCNSGYNWNGSQCKSNSIPSLPECSASSGAPCYDSTSNLTWSEKATSTMLWQPAVNHCTGLNSSNYGGYSSGWHLPTISELRTLINNCEGTQMPGGSCGVRDDEVVCLSSSCQGEDCYACSDSTTGGHSKFGETGAFWSSSTMSDSTDRAWYVNFQDGGVFNGSIYIFGSGDYVRCVRNSD